MRAPRQARLRRRQFQRRRRRRLSLRPQRRPPHRRQVRLRQQRRRRQPPQWRLRAPPLRTPPRTRRRSVCCSRISSPVTRRAGRRSHARRSVVRRPPPSGRANRARWMRSSEGKGRVLGPWSAWRPARQAGPARGLCSASGHGRGGVKRGTYYRGGRRHVLGTSWAHLAMSAAAPISYEFVIHYSLFSIRVILDRFAFVPMLTVFATSLRTPHSVDITLS